MADPKDSQSALDARFARKVSASRWALLFERLWPRLWLILGVAGLFILVSLLGLWPMLPRALHVLLLGAFALAGLAAVLYAARVPFPTHEEAVRRIERVSGIPHRPASSYEDTITANADDPRTSAIWRAHRARLAAALSRLRVGSPHPRADRADPIALRALLMLGVFAVAALVGDGAADRILSAFRFKSPAEAAERRLDAWVTPPSYTRRPPLMLADGAHASLAPASEAKVIQVPEKSVLIVRGSGSGLGNISLEVLNEGSTANERVEAKAPDAGKTSQASANISELRFELKKSAEVRVMGSGSQLASWVFYVIPDNPPKIALTKPPERTHRGSLKLTYTVEDDYGVVSAEAKLKKTDAEKKQADPAKDWARTNALTGPRPPHERPPQIVLRLPPASSSKEAQTYVDFGPHPYAGREVILTLEARDVAGNIGRSKPKRMVLPKRQFKKPLARAVVEQRAKLLDDPRNRAQVMRALEALTLEPEGFIDSVSVYLGLRTAYYSLAREQSRASMKSVTDGLWDLALWIEDGDLSDAERALREAQDKLAEALEKGAPDSEIDALMRELREALSRYVEQLTKNANQEEMQPPEGLDPDNQMLSQQDLERMMQELENMTRSGSREQAQQMLAQMRDLLERLQSGQMSQQEAQRGQMMMKKLDELGNLVGQQQRLMDETYRQQREGQRQPGGAMPGGKGDREGQGQRGRQGQTGEGRAGQEGQRGSGNGEGQQALSEQQRQLKEELERLRRSLDELGANSPELQGAREAMENAERSLNEGDMSSAVGDQQRALDQMREGAQKMAEDMQKNGASRYGQNGDMQRDPMGRPQRFQGPDAGNSVKVPDEIDIQRARAILEELRRRLAQPTRPAQELDYFERLLRRF
jgi:uncharacterized protein (TIGR02302 family)